MSLGEIFRFGFLLVARACSIIHPRLFEDPQDPKKKQKSGISLGR